MTSRISIAVVCSVISLGCASASRGPRGPEVTLDRYFAPVSSAVVSKVPPCQSLEKCGPAPVGTEWKCAKRDCWLSPRPVEMAEPVRPPADEPDAVAPVEAMAPLPDMSPPSSSPSTWQPSPQAAPAPATDAPADRPGSAASVTPPAQKAESDPYPVDAEGRPL